MAFIKPIICSNKKYKNLSKSESFIFENQTKTEKSGINKQPERY